MIYLGRVRINPYCVNFQLDKQTWLQYVLITPNKDEQKMTHSFEIFNGMITGVHVGQRI
jgi:hypothetical protein